MMSPPVRMFRANASRVRCKGRTRVQIRSARMARYGHWNSHWMAPPAAERFFRGFGRSRTFGISRSACGLERCPVAERRPISSRSSTHEWLVADDDVLEAPAWSLHHDLLVLGRSDQDTTQRRRGGHGASTGRLLLAVLRQEVRFLVVIVE